ncbi:ligand-binding sensor domain-containing protein [Thalassotalea euphylliae]|uniref:ligand-binding sensor domain-containing protein n=1 Tax=Thalassotalea euphylliae TaxID=1655234 RepID=UPI0011C05651|nr:sensor histidine kinase [Thalassotalea euphylliae]
MRTILRQTVLSNCFDHVRQLLLPLFVCIFTLCSLLQTASANTQIDNLAKIHSIAQDANGFVWLAGHQGLTRFDGSNSITFSASDANWTLPFTWAHEIEPFDDEFIVSSETMGTWLFNPTSGAFNKLDIDTEHESHYHSVEFNGAFYVSSANKIYRYDRERAVTQHLLTMEAPANLITSQTHLYMDAGLQGIYVYKDEKFAPVISETINVVADVGDLLIVVTPDTMYSLQGDKIIASTAVDMGSNGLAKENGSDNFFLIANNGDIKRYNASTLKELPHGYNTAKKARVKAAFHDRSKVLWLATSLGIERLVESSIKNHPIVFDIPNNSNEITLYEEELVIGSFGEGLKTFAPDSTIFPANINAAFSSKAKRIMDLQPVGDDLYIATFDGLWQFQGNTRQLTRVNFAHNDKLLIKLAHHNDMLYLGSNFNGLYIYDLNKEVLVDHITHEQGLPKAEIIDILPFDNGDTWLGTSQGISIYNRFSKYIKNIPNQGPNKIISLEYAADKVFAATLGDGIYILDRQGTLLSVIAQGIEFTYSSTIRDKVWIGSAAGLYKLDPSTHQITLVPATERYSFSDQAILMGESAFYAHYGGILEIPIEQQSFFNADVYISKTIVSGRQYLQNQEINISSASDVVSLDLVSLDYRPGQAKKFKYKINNSAWNYLSGNQLTLTGLASGNYNIEIMATNSLGQWSEKRAYANINVAYPWYWTPQIRVIYVVTLFCLFALLAWTFYLRTQSIHKIYLLLETEIQRKGKSALSTKRHLQSIVTLLAENKQDKAIEIAEQCISAFQNEESEEVPDGLYGSNLNIAVPYFAEYLHRKYHVKLAHDLYDKNNQLSYEMQSNIYKLIYEAITCAILHGDSSCFQLTLKEFKNKLWLTISDDEDSFSHFNNKVTFNMSMYYIRQIANKYNASVNTFEPSDNKGSQIVINFPMMLNS